MVATESFAGIVFRLSTSGYQGDYRIVVLDDGRIAGNVVARRAGRAVTAAAAAVMFWAALFGVVLFVVLANQKARATIMETFSGNVTEAFDILFERYGTRYGVDPLLLKAVAMVESSLDPDAINQADNISIGLMQILCRRDETGRCTNKFNIEGWEGANETRLRDPEYNVMMGAQILAWNLKTYGSPRGIAVYNAWNARHSPIDGPFPNQEYVDKVIAAYSKIQMR